MQKTQNRPTKLKQRGIGPQGINNAALIHEEPTPRKGSTEHAKRRAGPQGVDNTKTE